MTEEEEWGLSVGRASGDGKWFDNIMIALCGWTCASLTSGVLIYTGMAFVYATGFGGMGITTLVAWVFTLPTLLVRATFPHSMGWVLAACIGAVVGSAYAPLTHEFFSPANFQPGSEQWGAIMLVYAVTGAICGAVWWFVERSLRHRRNACDE